MASGRRTSRHRTERSTNLSPSRYSSSSSSERRDRDRVYSRRSLTSRRASSRSPSSESSDYRSRRRSRYPVRTRRSRSSRSPSSSSTSPENRSRGRDRGKTHIRGSWYSRSRSRSSSRSRSKSPPRSRSPPKLEFRNGGWHSPERGYISKNSCSDESSSSMAKGKRQKNGERRNYAKKKAERLNEGREDNNSPKPPPKKTGGEKRALENRGKPATGSTIENRSPRGQIEETVQTPEPKYTSMAKLKEWFMKAQKQLIHQLSYPINISQLPAALVKSSNGEFTLSKTSHRGLLSLCKAMESEGITKVEKRGNAHFVVDPRPQPTYSAMKPKAATFSMPSVPFSPPGDPRNRSLARQRSAGTDANSFWPQGKVVKPLAWKNESFRFKLSNAYSTRQVASWSEMKAEPVKSALKENPKTGPNDETIRQSPGTDLYGREKPQIPAEGEQQIFHFKVRKPIRTGPRPPLLDPRKRRAMSKQKKGFGEVHGNEIHETQNVNCSDRVAVHKESSISKESKPILDAEEKLVGNMCRMKSAVEREFGSRDEDGFGNNERPLTAAEGDLTRRYSPPTTDALTSKPEVVEISKSVPGREIKARLPTELDEGEIPEFSSQEDGQIKTSQQSGDSFGEDLPEFGKPAKSNSLDGPSTEEMNHESNEQTAEVGKSNDEDLRSKARIEELQKSGLTGFVPLLKSIVAGNYNALEPFMESKELMERISTLLEKPDLENNVGLEDDEQNLGSMENLDDDDFSLAIISATTGTGDITMLDVTDPLDIEDLLKSDIDESIETEMKEWFEAPVNNNSTGEKENMEPQETEDQTTDVNDVYGSDSSDFSGAEGVPVINLESESDSADTVTMETGVTAVPTVDLHHESEVRANRNVEGVSPLATTGQPNATLPPSKEIDAKANAKDFEKATKEHVGSSSVRKKKRILVDDTKEQNPFRAAEIGWERAKLKNQAKMKTQAIDPRFPLARTTQKPETAGKHVKEKRTEMRRKLNLQNRKRARDRSIALEARSDAGSDAQNSARNQSEVNKYFPSDSSSDDMPILKSQTAKTNAEPEEAPEKEVQKETRSPVQLKLAHQRSPFPVQIFLDVDSDDSSDTSKTVPIVEILDD